MTRLSDLACEIERLLVGGAALDPDGSCARRLLGELYDQFLDQKRLLDRLVHISDQYQWAERERGQAFATDYQREVRRIEKLVRISDSYQFMLRDVTNHMRMLSGRDDLTGLLNRRGMRERLEQEVAAVEAGKGAFALALFDIDHFKVVNDTWGHLEGDRVLQRVAAAVVTHLGESGICGRWGGEEFLILLPGRTMAVAETEAARLRGMLGDARHCDEGGSEFGISVSLGLTLYSPGESLDSVLRRADEALYAAKEAGRDRLIVL